MSATSGAQNALPSDGIGADERMPGRSQCTRSRERSSGKTVGVVAPTGDAGRLGGPVPIAK